MELTMNTLNFLTLNALRKNSLQGNDKGLTFAEEIKEFNKKNVDFRQDWMKPKKKTNLSNLMILSNQEGIVICYLSQTSRNPRSLIITKSGAIETKIDYTGEFLSQKYEKKYIFTAFLGIKTIEEKLYLVFAKSVEFKLRLLQLHNIYEIGEIRVIELESGLINQKITKELTEVYTDHGFMFSFTTDLTQNHWGIFESEPNYLFCWNQSMIKEIPDHVNMIFKLRITNGTFSNFSFEYLKMKKIDILLISRKVILNSAEDSKHLEKKFNRFKNVNCHHLRVEVSNLDGTRIFELKKYSYFSGFKDYIGDIKKYGEENIAYTFYEYFHEFNENNYLMDHHETVKTIVLSHYGTEERIDKVVKLVTAEDILRVNPDFKVFPFDMSLYANKKNQASLIDSELVNQIRSQVVKEEDWLDQDDDVNEKKIFLGFIDMEVVPVYPHISICFIILGTVIDKKWLRSEKFEIEKLIDFTKDHLMSTFSLFKAELQASIFKSTLKIAFGDICFPKNPSLKTDSHLFKLLNKYDMVTNVFKKFKKFRSPNNKLTKEKIERRRRGKRRERRKRTRTESFSSEKLKVYYLSWNLAGYIPDNEDIDACHQLLDRLFKKMKDPDLIVINLQELVELKPKPEVVIGMFKDKISNFNRWANFLRMYFLIIYDNYICIEQQNLLGLGLFIMVNRRISHKVAKPIVKKIKFGFLGAMPNKGSIIVNLGIFDSNIVIANTHLPSGQGKDKIKNRRDKVRLIVASVKEDELFDYDLMFIAGDLNLRAYGEWPFEQRVLRKLQKDLENDKEKMKQAKDYLESDEVKLGDKHDILGVVFKEGRLPVLPSYKVKAGQEEAIYKKNRRPSWTDRIFFHARSNEVRIRNTSLKTSYIPQSDHLLVYSNYEIEVIHFNETVFEGFYEGSHAI